MLELLIMDNEVQANIKKLINYAESHVVSYERMVEMHEKTQRGEPIDGVVGDNPNHAISLPLGFRVAFSIEVHPIGECRHISVSVNDGQPEYHDLLLVLDYFGFQTDLKDGKAHAYVEQYTINDVEHFAVNVVEPTLQ